MLDCLNHRRFLLFSDFNAAEVDIVLFLPFKELTFLFGVIQQLRGPNFTRICQVENMIKVNIE